MRWGVRKATIPRGRFLTAARLDETGGHAGLKADGLVSLSLEKRRRASDLAWAVHQAARFGPGRPQCLVRSLALRDLLRREGLGPCRVEVGVRKLDGDFQAHAWVELDAVVIGDDPAHIHSFRKLPEVFSVDLPDSIA